MIVSGNELARAALAGRSAAAEAAPIGRSASPAASTSFVPQTASFLGLLLAVLAGRRPDGWREPLAVTATLVSALCLLLAGLLWIAVVQGGD